MILSDRNPTARTVVWFILSVSTVLVLSTNGHGGDDEGNQNVLIISFDGFRWDYLSRTSTPNFDVIMRKGVHASRGIKPAFITKTFPNHFTLVTGLYEESHGIVGNTIYDPELDEVFDVRNTSQESSSRWFDVGAEPIWVTNQLQNKDGRSGCMQWIGCEAHIKGMTPTRHTPFTANMKYETRIDNTLAWFKGSYPTNLGLIYFQEPDGTAHAYGPDSDNVTKKIAYLDTLVGYLLRRLREEGLDKKTNVIITSDHGFAATGKDRLINLDAYIKVGTYRIFSSSPVASILPNKGMEDVIFKNLSAGATKTGHFKVFKNDSIPPEFHYTHNRRIMPIIVMSKENYSIVYNYSDSDFVLAGNHGYNNSLQDMYPFFVAMGPGFREGAEITTFDNVDVYPLMCHLLGLHPAPNNGSIEPLRSLLRVREKDEKTTVVTFGTYFFVLLVIGSVGGVFAVAACRQHRYLKRMQRTRVVAMAGGVKYSIPPANGGAKVPLLSDTSEEESFH
ncbi:bis(5'-adenosyl)-triphosphatase enpp4-like [Littorina saxatilis]|uniref:Uncharacterized protein n=1 Tax=Littorina saxatilis TaxID=31220 RepID=A0AAN9GI16_9CAEN